MASRTLFHRKCIQHKRRGFYYPSSPLHFQYSCLHLQILICSIYIQYWPFSSNQSQLRLHLQTEYLPWVVPIVLCKIPPPSTWRCDFDIPDLLLGWNRLEFILCTWDKICTQKLWSEHTKCRKRDDMLHQACMVELWSLNRDHNAY